MNSFIYTMLMHASEEEFWEQWRGLKSDSKVYIGTQVYTDGLWYYTALLTEYLLDYCTHKKGTIKDFLAWWVKSSPRYCRWKLPSPDELHEQGFSIIQPEIIEKPIYLSFYPSKQNSPPIIPEVVKKRAYASVLRIPVTYSIGSSGYVAPQATKREAFWHSRQHKSV